VSITATRQSRFWLLVVLACLQVGCGGCRKDAGDPRTLIPSESRLVVVVESVSDFQKPLAQFLSGIEGSKGLYELIDAHLGLDLADPDGLEAVGFDKETALVCFEHDGALSLAAGVSYPKRFLSNVQERIRILGPAQVTMTEGEKTYLATGPSLPEGGYAWSAAWGVTENNIGLMTWVGAGGDAEASWKVASVKPSDAFVKPSDLEAMSVWASGETPGLDIDFPIPMVGKFIKNALQGQGRWMVGVEVNTDTLRLKAKLPGGYGLGTVADYVQTDTNATDFSALFPKNSSLFLRSRVLLEKAGPLLAPALLLVKEPTYIDRLPLPPLGMLLDSLTGEFALAVMGMDDGVEPMTLLRHFNHLPRLLQDLHTVLAAEAQTEQKAEKLLKHVADHAGGAGFTSSSISHPAIEGIILTKVLTQGKKGHRTRSEKRVYTFLRKGRTLLVLTGEGELPRFLDVQDGKAIALSTAATDEHMRSVLRESSHLLSATLMSTRITRELADKGMPPFFLTVVNSIREVAFKARVESKSLNIVLEARQ
jgi:hypothetical protein